LTDVVSAFWPACAWVLQAKDGCDANQSRV
jgi:hypothetical protein